MPAVAWPAITSWPSNTSWPNLGNWPSAFPSTVTPAVWFDGRLPMYTDTAGTTLAAVGQSLGRSNEASPLVSNWQAPTNGQRGRRDFTAARLDYFGTVNPGQALTHSSTPSFTENDCTMLISFMPRDAENSPQNGLLRAGGYGIYAGNGAPALTYNTASANWTPVIPPYKRTQKTTIVARYTPTGLKLWQLSGGVLSSDTLVAAIAGPANTNPWIIGDGIGANQGFYGSVSQAMVVARGTTLTDNEALAMLYWADAQSVPDAFPISATLFAVIGDSIARGSPGVANSSWSWSALGNIRGTYPTCEMLNAAIGGSGVAITMYNPVIPFYSAGRARNVLVIASGTNDLANANGQVFVRDGLFTACDTARAAGWKVALATILDRTNAMAVSQATFDSQRAFVNAAITSSGTTHADAIIDLTGVAQVSANGAANNATFFSADLIHPIAAGNALMEPVYRAAMLALAA